MTSNSTFKDMFKVTMSNIISLLSSILNGFVIPIILGTLNYGYFKIFTLYTSYTILFHFGFNDGILLKYGGQKYNELNKYEFRSNSIFFIIFQFFVALIIMAMSLLATSHFYKILFLLLGINDFTQNLLGYYQNISQTVMRFTEYSAVNTIQYVSLIISVLSIWLYCKLYNLYNISFIPYVFLLIFVNSALVLWYLYDYRSITFGPHPSLVNCISTFKKYFITGAYMTFGYGVSVLIFNLDSQFVIKFFSTRTYGIYAFAYAMFSAGLTILESSAVVLLPHLKTHSKSYILKNYNNNVTYVLLFIYFLIVGFFPVKVIIRKFIYEYYGSIIYFRLLLPGIVITCCIDIIICNYYYALKKEKKYFYLNLIMLFLTFILDTIIYLIFKSPVMLAFSSTLSLLIWFILSNFIMNKWYHVKCLKNICYVIIMIFVFFGISNFNNEIFGAVFYLLVYLLISFVLFKHEIFILIKRVVCKD